MYYVRIFSCVFSLRSWGLACWTESDVFLYLGCQSWDILKFRYIFLMNKIYLCFVVTRYQEMAHFTDLNLPINVQTIGPLFQADTCPDQAEVKLTNILHNKLVRSKIPIYFQKEDPPLVSYKCTNNTSRSVFNYNQALRNINFDDYRNASSSCDCQSSTSASWSCN